MPSRGRSTFNKRQKEISRQEKRREKAARKQQRKLEKQASSSESPASSATSQWSADDLPPDNSDSVTVSLNSREND
jgi:hypothetical protein